MKKILIAVLTTFALSATSMAFAEEVHEHKAVEKNECLLAAKGCKDEVDSIQQKVKKINREIKKGTKVYSAEELKKLQQKLQEANEIINNLEKSGGR